MLGEGQFRVGSFQGWRQGSELGFSIGGGARQSSELRAEGEGEHHLTQVPEFRVESFEPGDARKQSSELRVSMWAAPEVGVQS